MIKALTNCSIITNVSVEIRINCQPCSVNGKRGTFINQTRHFTKIYPYDPSDILFQEVNGSSFRKAR